MSTAKPSISEPYAIDSPEGLELSRKNYIELYYYMQLNRMLEERLNVLYMQNEIVGGLYSSLGQEATSIGSAYALGRGDYLAPMIRNLGSLLLRGISPLEVMLQYLGRKTGPTKGKDTTLHLGSLEKGLIAPVSLLGDLIPVMAGVAMVLDKKRPRRVALTYIGDGGTSTAAFHEGLNFAAVRHLPLILFVENNLYAYSTPASKQANIENFADRAEAYGIYGEIIDGNNILAVLDATRRARKRCVEGGGPVLIESKTFRRKGHAAHDAADYVPAGLRLEWELRDPIDAYKFFLLSGGLCKESDIEKTDADITTLIDRAAAEALEAGYPDPQSALSGVYSNSHEPKA